MPPKIPPIPPSPDWKRALSTGMQFTEMRRSQGTAVVVELVAQGQLARDQVSAAVEEVLEMSRRRSDDFRKVVQNEVQRQLGALGLATKADLKALEDRVAGTTAPTKSATSKSASSKSATTKSAAAKKAPARKAAANKAAATKSAPTKKAPAKKPAPKAG